MNVIFLKDLNRTQTSLAGGKGANLGELTRIDGMHVPDGFCITTAAFAEAVGRIPALDRMLAELSQLHVRQLDRIAALSAGIRAAIESCEIPEAIARDVALALGRLGASQAYAVRSSATAEDLPDASFAGQQDSFLNVTGVDAILDRVRACWASLFTARAVTYRMQQGYDHRKVQLAVVVQRMIAAQVSGVLFTADPVSGHRRTVTIDATFGLGDALVAGQVNADHFKVREGVVAERNMMERPTLTDAQVLALEQIGRKIEAHFGSPQDVEWCLEDGRFYIVQSRPVTTLFPVPEPVDEEHRVYVSVGHQQMMTDAFRPFGLSFFLMMTHAPMRPAAGRLFVDVTRHLAAPERGKAVIDALGKSDPLIKDALRTIQERGDFIQLAEPEEGGSTHRFGALLENPPPIESDPAIAADLIRESQAALDALQKAIAGKTGPALFDFIAGDLAALKQEAFDPRSMQLIVAAINASGWVNEKMYEWLGEKNAADVLAQSVPNNVTSEMGLALLDVADAIRPFPKVVSYLENVQTDDFRDALLALEGGQAAGEAIQAFLDRYGMRCVGEIDITRTRWAEKPSTLIPMILTNVRNFKPGEARRKFERGLREAAAKENELLERLAAFPDGEAKVAETKRMIAVIRHFAGYREYPKYALISRLYMYKRPLMEEAEAMVRAGLLREKEDIFFLTFEELRTAAAHLYFDYERIAARKKEYRLFEKLTPPRVITSDGEIISGKYYRDSLPAGAIPGLPVSAGMVEGRARVILDIEAADVQEGDILVTRFTDPSWTPLFVSIRGLVTEVGGLMTHGAVIAREYGLPAVVGVERATTLIRDGQRIRVHGTDGFVEILEES